MTPAFKDEVQFLAWGDGPSGPWIKVLLPSSDDLEPFRGMTSAKKGMAGQRMACVLVEITDDEQPAPATDATIVEAAKEAVKAKGGELAKLAGILCADEEFQLWFVERYGNKSPTAEVSEATVTERLRYHCGVKSRAELDHNLDAAAKFHQIRKAWVASGVTR